MYCSAEKAPTLKEQAQPLETAKLWLPTGSYSFSAYSTFEGKMWDMRSGPHVSVLRLNGTGNDFKMRGTYFIDSDAEGWKLFHILIASDLEKFSSTIAQMVESHGNSRYEDGKRDAQRAIRVALGVY